MFFIFFNSPNFLDGETGAQRAHYFPEITEQLVFVLLPSYHDVSRETEPEYSKENKNKNKPKKENKNIKWKNMRTRWLILHGGFDPDVISSKGFSLTTLWKSIPSIINYSLVSETSSVFSTELTTLWHYFLFFFARNPDQNVRSMEAVSGPYIPSVESSVWYRVMLNKQLLNEWT